MAIQAKTLQELFVATVAAHADRPAQEWFDGAEWKGRSYEEFGQAVNALAAAMQAAGLKRGDRVAIWSKNSPRWAEADFACLTAGFVSVPIYDTLTADKAAYILNDAQAKLVFVEDASLCARLDKVRGDVKGVKTVVILSGAAAPGSMSYEAFVASAAGKSVKRPAVVPDDLASLVYTSGTTGEPKGVMLTHGNFASNASTALSLVEITPQDVFLSFLPLSHVFERTGGHFAAYGAGAKVVFARSLEALMDDMQYAKPTLMMAVPRL